MSGLLPSQTGNLFSQYRLAALCLVLAALTGYYITHTPEARHTKMQTRIIERMEPRVANPDEPINADDLINAIPLRKPEKPGWIPLGMNAGHEAVG